MADCRSCRLCGEEGNQWKTDLSWEVEAFVVAEISTRLARPSESPILDAG